MPQGWGTRGSPAWPHTGTVSLCHSQSCCLPGHPWPRGLCSTAASLSPAQARAARSWRPRRGDTEGRDVPKGHRAVGRGSGLPESARLCPEMSHAPGEEVAGDAENHPTHCSPAPCPAAVPRCPAPHPTGCPGRPTVWQGSAWPHNIPPPSRQ